MTTPLRILVVDNYDSFVFNLVQYLGQLGAECDVRRNDERRSGRRPRCFDGVLLSPGPGTPEAAGVCVPLIQQVAGHVPVFGVCLGLQAIAVAYGARVTRAPELLHGKTSHVHHQGAGVLAGLPDPFVATATTRSPWRRTPLPASSPSRRAPAAEWSWPCGTGRSPWRAFSSTPSRCSPRVATRCWPRGWPRAATARRPGRARGLQPVVRRGPASLELPEPVG
jgi:hypothetical protein